MREVWLLCEGKEDSLDVRVIDGLLSPLAVNARVQPVAGEKSFGVARELISKHGGFGAGGRGTKPVRIVFSVRDRNYSGVVVAAASWADPNGKELIWRRHEIENYLLEPEIVRLAANSLASGKPIVQDDAHAGEILVRIARSQAECHAGHVLRVEMESGFRSLTDRTDFNVPKNKQLFFRPEWVGALRRSFREFRRELLRRKRLRDMPTVEIRRRYDRILDAVRSPGYLSRMEFLRDFDGKRLLSGLIAELKPLVGNALKRHTLETALVDALVKRYQDVGNPFRFVDDEFVNLANRLRLASK
jgi:hypothetical protein